MKNIIIFSISISISITTSAISAQSLPELIKQYEKECSAIVPDTIEQTGKITYDLVPVKNANGVILHYALGTPDTVWNAPNCPEYKEYHSGFIFYNSLNNARASEKANKTEVSITRKYICEVKLREVEPFSEDFWNWLRKQTK